MISTNKITFDIGHCDSCDISVNCHFVPSRSEGIGHSLMYITSSPTSSEYKNGLCTSKKHKIIRDFDTQFNFNSYYTSIVKCIGASILFDHEINECNKHLRKELFIVQPKVIITIGDIPTRQFLEYNFFKEVVNKPNILTLNNKEVIIYPIYSPTYFGKTKEDSIEYYNNSFIFIAKLYKSFIDTTYFNILLL